MAEPGVCDLCQEDFNEDSRCPRILPCSHHFCTSCIHKLLVNRMKACPICRKDFVATSVKDFMVNRGILDFIRYLASQSTSRQSTSTTICSNDTVPTSRSVQERRQSFGTEQTCNNDNNNINSRNQTQDSEDDGRQSAYDEWFDTNEVADHESDEYSDVERDLNWGQGDEEVDIDDWGEANDENEDFDDNSDWGEPDDHENIDDNWDPADAEQGNFENGEDWGNGDEEHEQISDNEWDQANDEDEDDFDDWGQAVEGHRDNENEDWAEANDGPGELNTENWGAQSNDEPEESDNDDHGQDDEHSGAGNFDWDHDEVDQYDNDYHDNIDYNPVVQNESNYIDGNDSALDDDYYFEENNDCIESDQDYFSD